MDEPLDLTPLAETTELARRGDPEGAVTRLVEFGLTLITGIQGLGALLGQGFAAGFELSAQARMRRAIAALEAEQDERARQQRLAQAVVEALKDALFASELGLAPEPQRQAQARLDETLAAIRQAVAEGQIHIHQERVEAGSTGLEFEGTGHAVKARQEVITGEGTVGARFKQVDE